jgi:hypothetical protein
MGMSARARHRAIAVTFAILGLAASAYLSGAHPRAWVLVMVVVTLVVSAVVWLAAPPAVWADSPSVEVAVEVAVEGGDAHPYRVSSDARPRALRVRRVPARSTRRVALFLLGCVLASVPLCWVHVAVAVVACWLSSALVLASYAARGDAFIDDGVGFESCEAPLLGDSPWRELVGWPEVILTAFVAMGLLVARALVDYAFPLALRLPYAVARRALGLDGARRRTTRDALVHGAVWATALALPLAALTSLVRVVG